MAGKTEAPQHSQQAAGAYNRILERVDHALASLEGRTWETVKDEIDKAVEVEVELGELTRDEIELLKAYVRRDLQDLRYYVHETGDGVAGWMGVDLSVVEAKARDLLLSIADKTQVEMVELEQRLQHDAGSYMAGEIACAGMLQCLNCGHMLCLVETTEIQPCHTCGQRYFKRITARWPREPEIEAEPPIH